MLASHSARVSVLAALLLAAACLQAQAPVDPVRQEPARDTQFPPGQEEVRIPSHGSTMNAFLYLAQGAGSHPVVVFLHGYPGNERNIDLAQAVRRAGYDALFLDYRGSWGSGGAFSFQHALEDGVSALAWVRMPATVRQFHFDPARVALVGHSLGGWVALEDGAREPAAVCVAALAGWNVGWAAARFPVNPKERDENLTYFRKTTDANAGPIRAQSANLVQEMAMHASAWDFLARAVSLKDHAVLVIGATHDTPDEDAAMSVAMAQALTAAGGRRVTSVTYDDDHPFSAHRLALADALVRWLDTDCASAQLSPPRAPVHEQQPQSQHDANHRRD